MQKSMVSHSVVSSAALNWAAYSGSSSMFVWVGPPTAKDRPREEACSVGGSLHSAAKDRNSYKAGGAAAQRAGAAQHPGPAQQEMVRVWSLVALEVVASSPIISGITHIADTHGRFAQQEHDAVLAPDSLNTPGNPAATNGSHQLPPSLGADRPGGYVP